MLTHALAPEPASYFPQKKDGEAELHGAHPAPRESDKGPSSHRWAAMDGQQHAAPTAAWKQTARAGLGKEGGNLFFHNGDRTTREKNGRMIDDS